MQNDGYRNREWGRIAEGLAAEYLIKAGYIVRERNFRISNHIEIDIIAEKGNSIVFVEVKARSGNFADAIDAVDKRKRTKMVRGANIYLKNLDHLYEYRFDIITLTGNEYKYTLEHIPDAFLPPLNGKF